MGTQIAETTADRSRSTWFNKEALEAIAATPFYRSFVPTFRQVTGLSLSLLPAQGCGVYDRAMEAAEPEFCRLLRGCPPACLACRRFGRLLCARAAEKQQLVCERCYAGLVEAAIPLVSGNCWAGTLITGRVRSPVVRPGCEAEIERLLSATEPELAKRIRQSWSAVSAPKAEQLERAFSLLRWFAWALQERLPAWLADHYENLPPAVGRAKKYLVEHYAEPVRLGAVAHHAGMSMQHLSKVFHESMGRTFTDFSTELRVENAKALLRNDSQRIAEIAFASGFGSLATFNRVFKRRVGLAPTAYRRTVHENRVGEETVRGDRETQV